MSTGGDVARGEASARTIDDGGSGAVELVSE
eukprot:CAMPEP_0181352636 /NCGR_PEP_ID=MMETSP1106-20121128/2415_1 /TAXON_ID=81844 /ORGANISM="Mantoniella antarctica, Strain SL-175" /LENGTH=30 /DNA_ID= /DNA_START= /DNA_END= /DNA_ORIENTATION=